MYIRGLSILVKPTHKCNLNCEYCYDRPNRDKIGDHIMSLELVEEIVKRIPDNLQTQWIWHGGECTTVPVEWFDKANEIIRKYFRKNITQSMQSNGFDVSDEFLEMCKRNKIGIGFSYDFDTQVLRSGNNNLGALPDVLFRAKKIGLSTGTITVIHNKNVHKMIDFYEAAKEMKMNEPAFNNVFSSPGTEEYNLDLDNDIYWSFFKDFTNYVFHDQSNNATLERTLRLGTALTLGCNNEICRFGSCICNYMCIDPIGRVLPCDRVYPDKYVCQDVRQLKVLTDYWNTPEYKLWMFNSEVRRRIYCEICEYNHMCNGGCPTQQFDDTNDDPTKCSNLHCSHNKYIFDICWECISKINPYEETINTRLSTHLLNKEIFIPAEIKLFCELLGLSIKEDSGHWTESHLHKLTSFLNKGKQFNGGAMVYTKADWERFRVKRFRSFVNKLKYNKAVVSNYIEGDIDEI